MWNFDYMNRSSTRGIFLSIILLFSITIIIFSPNAYAEEITVKSIALDETTILELTNYSNGNVNTLRIWLGSDFNFKSFKTEEGWIGEKTPQGVIIFTSSEQIKPGESVKFGVKTDKSNPSINWKALDSKDTQMSTGLAIADKLPTLDENQNFENIGESISAESTFRIIPDKPNAGSSIRVTGDNFGAVHEFDFYIDTEKIGIFETDENGHFMTTMKIPNDQKAERVDFIVKDKEGKEKKLSIRLGEDVNQIPDSENIPLTIKGLPEIIHRGDFLEISGTAQTGSAITSTIRTPDGEIGITRIAEVDRIGNWELPEPVIVPLDAPFGEYTATISDGRNEIKKSWTVESDKIIVMVPIKLKFDQGEIMKFNGTALPNKSIEMVLEDPLGKEIASDIIKIGDSGKVKFEFPTTQNTPEGTYTLITTQEKHKEFSYAGIGQIPTIPVNLEFDKLSYKAGETAIITLSGKASEIINLLIVDPSDKPIEDPVSITLQPDGRGTHSIELKGYSAGVYTAIISKGSAQSTEAFTVGLLTGSGEIKINTTKTEYHNGDSILILGQTSTNVILTLTMIDPNGDKIKIKETFSDRSGRISESSFRIPSDAIPGTWKINAKSGSNFANIEIQVLAVVQEGLVVQVDEGQDIPGFGKTMNIHVFGAKQNVVIEIIAESGKIIEKLAFPASSNGEINQPWIIPQDIEPGTYTIKVADAFNDTETTYKIG